MKNLQKMLTGTVGVLMMTSFIISPIQAQALNLNTTNHAELPLLQADARITGEVKQDKQDKEDEDYDYRDYKNDDRLPSGIRTSTGIENRIEAGKGFPFGIFNKIFRHREKNDHREEVVIKLSDIKTNVLATEATLSFTTNVDTQGTLMYSTNSDLATGVSVTIDTAKEHSVTIKNLTPDTKYYAKLELTSSDEKINYETNIRSFTTEKLDQTTPAISFLHAFGIDKDSVNIIWLTTERTDAKVWVSTNADVDTSVAPTAFKESGQLFHVFQLGSLEAGTKYYIKVMSTDEQGNATTSETLSVTTDAA